MASGRIILRAKVAKDMEHNYYGEPAWPNNLLCIFPVVNLDTFAGVLGLPPVGLQAYSRGTLSSR